MNPSAYIHTFVAGGPQGSVVRGGFCPVCRGDGSFKSFEGAAPCLTCGGTGRSEVTATAGQEPAVVVTIGRVRHQRELAG